MVVYSLLRESDREFGIRTTISPTPTVVGGGFSQPETSRSLQSDWWE